MDTTPKPSRCHRCRTRRHLYELVERTSGDHVWLLCVPCAVFHDAWQSHTAIRAAMRQAGAEGAPDPTHET